MSICFTGHSSPGPWRSDLTIYWALGPFVRSFILLVDPGDICPPQPQIHQAPGWWNTLVIPQEVSDHEEPHPQGRWGSGDWRFLPGSNDSAFVRAILQKAPATSEELFREVDLYITTEFWVQMNYWVVLLLLYLVLGLMLYMNYDHSSFLLFVQLLFMIRLLC
jgi:hypothetical protein